MLKQDYKDEGMTMSDSKALAIKVLSKTLDMTKLSAEKGKLWDTILNTVRTSIMCHNLGLSQQSILGVVLNYKANILRELDWYKKLGKRTWLEGAFLWRWWFS